jgi:hydroxymethylbilane synthase
MTKSTVKLATRKSALALAQARALVRELRAIHPDTAFDEVLITTTGDKVQDRLLSEIGGKGLFVKEIEEALLDGRADLAVHSLKDVPPELPEGLVLGCFPEREDPRDVLISASGLGLMQLPAGSRIGTSSLRRRIQLQAARPDLVIEVLRGNVDTRLRKCREGQVDAVILARAGLARLGLLDQITEVLAPEIVLPAVGQGALAIEHRASDERTHALIAPLSHRETKISVLTERAVLRSVAGDCQTPVAAFAEREAAGIRVRGFLAGPDGSNPRRAELRVPWPGDEQAATELGAELGRRLL